jgi:hypothetical protein
MWSDRFNEVVWARVASYYPWWPSLVINIDELLVKEGLEEKSKKFEQDRYLVYFYNSIDGDFAFLPISAKNIQPFGSEKDTFAEGKGVTVKHKKSFTAAIATAMVDTMASKTQRAQWLKIKPSSLLKTHKATEIETLSSMSPLITSIGEAGGSPFRNPPRSSTPLPFANSIYREKVLSGDRKTAQAPKTIMSKPKSTPKSKWSDRFNEVVWARVTGFYPWYYFVLSITYAIIKIQV